MDSSKQALVHMAAAIKVICPHMKTMESMRIVKFKVEDINHASSYRRAIDRRVAQLKRNNKSASVPVPVITIPLEEDVIKVSTWATSFLTLTGDDQPPDHLLQITSRKKALHPSIITDDPFIMAEMHSLKSLSSATSSKTLLSHRQFRKQRSRWRFRKLPSRLCRSSRRR